ncbi:Histone acetyltransferase, partial [Caligus rogercresseyi]
VWYQSPTLRIRLLPKMYICEFCLKYLKSETCVWKHPPGDEIYRKDKLSVFEICGPPLQTFFLDHKTLYIDVEPFLFYVMTIADSEGCHIVGYFSKEKTTYLNYNRQGYGRLLIEFSYLLSRSENKVGSPEKPLSDLGLITYRAYWKDVLLEYICNHPDKEISIKSFSEEMGINSSDIVSTLQYLGMIKYWKGKHIILKKEDLIEDFLRKMRNRTPSRKIYASALKWKPYEPTSRERRQAIQIKKIKRKSPRKDENSSTPHIIITSLTQLFFLMNHHEL